MRRALGCAAWLLLAGVPASAQDAGAQPPLHASLRGWADDIWLRILNRTGATEGRLSEFGILQRFHAITDANYAIDLISNRFSLSENYDWYHREGGVRWAGGSVTTRDLAHWLEFKVAVPFARAWNFNIRYNAESSLEVERNVLRAAIDHRWTSGWFAYGGGTLVTNKADIDLMAGGGWRSDGPRPAEVSLTLAWLDPLNDHLYLQLGINPRIADTVVAYERQGLALQFTAELPIGQRLRGEAHAALTRPAIVSAYLAAAPDSGFRETDRAGYFAGLLEWMIARRASVGLMVSHAVAEIQRTPLAAGSPDDDFIRREVETSAGAFALARVGRSWTLEAWLARNWRPERKVTPPADSAAVDYEDRAWSGTVTLTFGRPSGFTADIGFVMDFRDILRGAGAVPSLSSLDRNNARARLDVGWRLENYGFLVLGAAFDLDTPNSLFRRGTPDGYRARVEIRF